MTPAPERMRVARLYRWGDVRTETVPVPEPGRGEALLRVEACGVCGSDALRWYVDRKAPAVLGHEPAGVIVACGDGVTRIRPGDRVFVHHHAPCGSCIECRRGLWSNCAVWKASQLDPGGFAEYVRVPAINLHTDTLVLPASMDFETATFIEPVACCVRAVRRHGALRPGDAVAIVGLGAMGLVMAQLARDFGAAVIVGSDFRADRRALACRLGVDTAVDPREVRFEEAVRAQTGGRGADVVLICPIDDAAFADGLDAAAPGARVVCFTPRPPDRPLCLDQSKLYFREVTVAQSYSCGPDETRDALRLLDEQRIDVRSLVTHREPLDRVDRALERAAGKADGIKSIVYPHRTTVE